MWVKQLKHLIFDGVPGLKTPIFAGEASTSIDFCQVSTQMAENLAQWKTLWVEDAKPNDEALGGWTGLGLGMGVEDWLFTKVGMEGQKNNRGKW